MTLHSGGELALSQAAYVHLAASIPNMNARHRHGARLPLRRHRPRYPDPAGRTLRRAAGAGPRRYRRYRRRRALCGRAHRGRLPRSRAAEMVSGEAVLLAVSGVIEGAPPIPGL